MELEQNFLICSDLLFKNFQIEFFLEIQGGYLCVYCDRDMLANFLYEYNALSTLQILPLKPKIDSFQYLLHSVGSFVVAPFGFRTK